MFESKREKELENEVRILKDNMGFLNRTIEAYREKIEYCSKLNGSLNESIRLKNEEINSLRYANFKLKKENNTITQEEYIILKSLSKSSKWIYRESGNLYLRHQKTEKKEAIYFREWIWNTDFSFYNHLFKFVKDGEEPMLISDILNRDLI